MKKLDVSYNQRARHILEAHEETKSDDSDQSNTESHQSDDSEAGRAVVDTTETRPNETSLFLLDIANLAVDGGKKSTQSSTPKPKLVEPTTFDQAWNQGNNDWG